MMGFGRATSVYMRMQRCGMGASSSAETFVVHSSASTNRTYTTSTDPTTTTSAPAPPVSVYRNRNPAALHGTDMDVVTLASENQQVTKFRRYGLFYNFSNRRIFSDIYYAEEVPGKPQPKITSIVSGASDEPHFMKTLYSCTNQSAAKHLGKMMAKRAHECGILDQVELIKYKDGRTLDVLTERQRLRVINFETSKRFTCFWNGFVEMERELLGDAQPKGRFIVPRTRYEKKKAGMIKRKPKTSY